MRVLPPVEEQIRRIIRDTRAKDPLITVSGLKAALEKHFGRGFSHQYVSKIADKVAREGLIEIDRAKIEERLASTRETFRISRERLIKIIYWSPQTAEPGIKAPLPMDQIEAAKSLAMLDLALLKAEIDCGMYKKPVEAIAKEFQYEPVPGEVRAVIIAAWQRGGLLPRATVEQMVPVAAPVAHGQGAVQ